MMNSEVIYAPPPGPPPSHDVVYSPPPGPPPITMYRPSLLPAAFSLLSQTQAHSLSAQGFTTLPISNLPVLRDAALALFAASRSFFAEPESHKSQFSVSTNNPQGSEEGWSRVVGEKELLTVRRGGNVCPPSIEHEARVLWHECGVFMQEVVRGIEQSLGLPQDAFKEVVSPECTMPIAGAERLETLLRMFRYERQPNDPDNDVHAGKGRLVSEAHHDLGLLSLVMGASPGLEVWDIAARAWIPIEESPYTVTDSGISATLLVGETLTRLTNARYAPGRHRVFVPPPSSPDPEAQFRYSLVFALRPHAEARISTAALTTPITGTFLSPLVNVRARDFFAAIARIRWNVNTDPKVREAQRMRMLGGLSGIGESKEIRPENCNKESKKKRWSISGHHSTRQLSGEGSSLRSNWYNIFQRITRR